MQCTRCIEYDSLSSISTYIYSKRKRHETSEAFTLVPGQDFEYRKIFTKNYSFPHVNMWPTLKPSAKMHVIQKRISKKIR